VLFECGDLHGARPGPGPLGATLAASLRPLCNGSLPEGLFTLKLDCRYRTAYRTAYRNGWLERAYVAPLNRKRYLKKSQFYNALDVLVRSVHRMSKEVVLLYAVEGEVDYEELGLRLDPKWPRLVVFWLPPAGVGVRTSHLLPPTAWSFNFVRAMLLSFSLCAVQINVGNVLGPLVDRLFNKTRAHGAASHPYPILPSMNLGHNNPSFTFHALPFLADAFFHGARRRALSTVHVMGNDWLAEPFVAARLTKQWCKWDLGAYMTREIYRTRFSLEQSTTFAVRAAKQPMVYGYLTFCPEVDLDMVSMREAWNTSQSLATALDHSKVYVAYQGKWYHEEAAAARLALDCIL